MKGQPIFKYLNNKDPWMLAEHFPDVDFFFAQIWLSSFVNNLKISCGKNYKKVLAVFHPKFYIHFYYGRKDSLNLEKHLVNLIKKDKLFGLAINRNIIKWSDKLTEFANRIEKLDLSNKKNSELWRLFEQQDDIHTHLYEWGWLSNATDMFHSSFTIDLQNYLSKKVKKNVNEIFNVLTTPTEKSLAAIEDEKILKIANLIKKNKGKVSNKINEKISKHHKQYSYIKHLWLGRNGIYKRNHYLKIAVKLANDLVPPAEKNKQINRKLSDLKTKKQQLFKKLKINQKYQYLFSVYSGFMLTKVYRRYSQIFWAYQMKKLMSETAKRLELSLDEIRYMLPSEIKKGLIEKKVDKKEIKKRLNLFLYYVEKGKELISTNKNHPILSQLKYNKIKEVQELKGQIACLGKASGKVKIVNNTCDMNKIRKGDILVSIVTNPDLVPAMKKASAIITEQGGVTSHAAIVSRELNIPCIIGTKIATKVLKDGDKVEVDANKGMVKKL